MIRSEIRVLLELAGGQKGLSELTRSMGKSPSWISELVGGLAKKGLVERTGKGKAQLRKGPKLNALLRLADMLDLMMLLEGSNETVLLSLTGPMGIPGLARATGLSTAQLYRSLGVLGALGAVKKKDGRYHIALPEVSRYAELLREELIVSEPSSRVLFNGKERISRVARGVEHAGVPTAFSRFADLGVPFYPVHDYYFEPAGELAMEDILVHAMLSSGDKKQFSLCIIFLLKNRNSIISSRVADRSAHFGVRERWLDVLAYLDRRPVANPAIFLPWPEFKLKAEDYGIRLPEKFPGAELESELRMLGEKLQKDVDVFLIGGGNFILQGLKDSTKDLDVIVRNRAHFDILMKGLRDAGYEEPHSVERPYRELASSAMMEKPGRPRWDIFVGVVCRAIRLGDHMLGRAKFHARLGKLKLYLMAAEDIFLFKSVTDREGDLEDAALLARKGLVNWNVVLEELKEQERRGGRLFCIDVLQTLEILEERYGIRPPILRRVESHCLRQGLLSALKGGPKSMKQLKALVDFSDYQIYNALKALKNAGKVRTVRKDGLNYYAIRR